MEYFVIQVSIFEIKAQEKMNTTYYQNQVNKIEKEIADLNKKIAMEYKKENDKNNQINSIRKSITKSTSTTSLQNKDRQIQSHQKSIQDIKKRVADLQNKIATKTTELGRKKQDLRKAEEKEIKKRNEDQLSFQRNLQDQIDEQTQKLELLIQHNFSGSPSNSIEHEPAKTYDFFISHATEDKDDIVRALAEHLNNLGFKVWYDEFELKWGDSLRKNIDKGLASSKYGVVIISPSFIKKNWTEYELNGMVAKEMNGHKVILPIWHKITKDEVLQFSPSLADKLALNTSLHTIEDIGTQLKQLLNKE